MTHELALSLALFAFTSSITPGPNNLMLLASGANFGARRTIPHMAGVAFGFLILMFMIGLGLAQVFAIVPYAHTILKALAFMFMVYMAYRIAFSRPNMDGPNPSATPITFWQAIAFQWVNPKAIGMAISAVTVYVPSNSGLWGLALAVLIFGSVNCPCVNVWMLAGTQMRRILNTATRVRIFNVTAAILLLVSSYPILTATQTPMPVQAQIFDAHSPTPSGPLAPSI